MKVCICEKPSVAKDVAKVLGASNIKDGYFEGNGYQVTWTYGHLCGLKMPEEYYKEWKRWTLSYLPMIPPNFGIKVMEQPSITKQFNIIKSLIQTADEVINCGDAGQEGELIQRWVIQLSKPQCSVKRLWISSLTEESIRKGFDNLQPSGNYDNLYYAGLSRAIGDWLLGLNATRYYTLRNTNRTLFSVGRVQTPTLAMVVNRDREIEAFNSEEFFTLSTTTKGCKLINSKKYTDKNEVDNILKELNKEDLIIKEVKTSTKSEKPNKLFDLTSLQVFCNNAFGYSAEDTLNATQSLYEKKLLTYPRVDTCYLTNDIYKECPSILSSLKGGYDYINKLDLNNLQKRKMVFDDSKVTDHHAIIPTGRQMWNLSEIESNVFDSVVKRFICVFYPDYIYDETNIIGESAGIEFKTNGRIVKDLGFYEVLNTQPSDNIIPDFIEGEVLSHKPKMEKKSTTPPQAFTEATLLRAMETAGKVVEEQEFKDAMKENGIGRPSTRASIIEMLVKRGYLYKEKKKILSTDLGKKLIDSIDNELLKSVKLTGEWEYKLRQIERGEYSPNVFIDELKAMLKNIIKL